MIEQEGARSYKGKVIGDSMAITINFKWALQILLLVGALVYGYWEIEARIKTLENMVALSDEQIENLLDKHIAEEKIERAELEEKISFYEQELKINLNPLSWKKRKIK